MRGEAEKRRLLLEQLDKAGQQQLRRGRVRCGPRVQDGARARVALPTTWQVHWGAPCMYRCTAEMLLARAAYPGSSQLVSAGVLCLATRGMLLMALLDVVCAMPRSSMLHGAMRTAEESKLGRERYGDRGSAGQYITRKQQQQAD